MSVQNKKGTENARRAAAAFICSALMTFAFLRGSGESVFMITIIWAGLSAVLTFMARSSLFALPRPGAFLCCLFLGFFFLAGRIYMKGYPFPGSPSDIAVCLLCLAGFTVFWTLMYHLLEAFITGRLPRPGLQRLYRLGGSGSAFDRHPFRFSLIVLLICHLPHLLVKYPAAFCYDAGWQVEQGLGITALTTHHPVLHTYLMTGLIRLGMLFGSANAGIFLFVLAQMIICVLIYADAVALVCQLGAPRFFRYFALAFFGLFPFVTVYTGQVVKDVLYTAFFLLFMLQLIRYADLKDRFWNRRDLAKTGAACLMVCLLRNNGAWILIPTLAVMAFLERKALRRALYWILCALLPVLALGALNRVSGAKNGSIAEALSLPMQQTARYALCGYPLTPQEEEAVKAVLPYDDLKNIYNPYISDPVKEHFSKDAGTDELIAWMKAWLAMGIRHPMCYVQATLIQNYFLFYPEYTEYDYSATVTSGGYSWKKMPFSSPAWLMRLQKGYERFFHALHRLPVTGMLFANFFWMCMSVLLLGVMITKKIRGRYLLFLPLILASAIIVAGPCICYHPRYSLPIVYAFPALLGYCASRVSVSRSRAQ